MFLSEYKFHTAFSACDDGGEKTAFHRLTDGLDSGRKWNKPFPKSRLVRTVDEIHLEKKEFDILSFKKKRYTASIWTPRPIWGEDPDYELAKRTVYHYGFCHSFILE